MNQHVIRVAFTLNVFYGKLQVSKASLSKKIIGIIAEADSFTVFQISLHKKVKLLRGFDISRKLKLFSYYPPMNFATCNG